MSVPYAPARWPAATATAGIWALAAASVVFWGLRLTAPSDAVAPPAVVKAPLEPDPAAVAQMLGAVSNQPVAATPEAASRFALLGVVADADQQGAALIAVDGKPARPFKVGAKVVDGFVLQSVTTRGAALGPSADGKAALTLQLPTRPLAMPSPSRPLQPPLQPALAAPPQPAAVAPTQPAVAAPPSPAGAPPAITAPPPFPPNFPTPGVAPVMAPPAEPS